MNTKVSPYAFRSAAIAALGGLLFGFDTAVISGTIKSLERVFLLDAWWLGFTVTSALIGTILGAATAQIPSNRFGRKPTLIVMAALYFISAVGSAYPELLAFGKDSNLWFSFLFFRFIGGIGVGASSVVSPLYTAEISPAKSRGLLVGLTQFNIVFGILVAFFSNFAIKTFGLGGEEAWRYMFGVEAIPAAAFFFLLFVTPESPRWLITKGKVEQAKKILDVLGTDAETNEEEVRIIQNAIAAESEGEREKFFSHKYRFPIMLAICIAAFNQLSGINAILYYAPTIFEMTGAGESLAYFFPVIIGATNLIFTMAALAVVDKFGRRTLLFIGSLGYIASMGIVATTFMTYSPQFNSSMANYAVSETHKKVEDCEKALSEAETQESETFWSGELKNALADSLLAVEDAQIAARQLEGESVASRTKKEKEEIKKQLILRENDELAKEIETKIATVDATPVVPMTGIYIVLGGLMFFIASHAFGSGACIWTFIGEIFPNRVRAQGQALGSFVHWVLCAIVSQLFLPLLGIFGPTVIFYGFSGLMVFQLLWTIFLMPETKCVSLEDLQRKLGITKD